MLSHLQGYSLTRESSSFFLVIFSTHLQGYSLTRESLRDSLVAFDSLIWKLQAKISAVLHRFQTEMILLNTNIFAAPNTVYSHEPGSRQFSWIVSVPKVNSHPISSRACLPEVGGAPCIIKFSIRGRNQAARFLEQRCWIWCPTYHFPRSSFLEGWVSFSWVRFRHTKFN